MKATDLLKKQHKEVKALFKKVENTESGRERRRLMDEIATALQGHTTIEEEMFYPAVRGLETQKAEEMVMEAYEEHHVVKLVLAELPQVDPEDERFEAKMTVLSELVEHHADEEEKEMSPPVRSKTNATTRETLGEQLATRKVELGAPPMEMALDLTLEELKDLPNVVPEDERFEAKMTVLSELVEHHVEEEEGEMFKLAERLGKEELQDLAEQMQEHMGQVTGRRAA